MNIFSTDIGMTFCASKCAHFSLKRGKYRDVLHQERLDKNTSDVFDIKVTIEYGQCCQYLLYLPVIRYAAGIVKWNLNDLRTMNKKTRKLLTINKGLHPRSDVDHPYLSERKEERN